VERIKAKLKSDRKSKCEGDCCLSVEQLGPFQHLGEFWQSKCACRYQRVECSEECGCDA